MFFFEKKNQKTFINLAGVSVARRCLMRLMDKSFLFLFFKKESLPL